MTAHDCDTTGAIKPSWRHVPHWLRCLMLRNMTNAVAFIPLSQQKTTWLAETIMNTVSHKKVTLCSLFSTITCFSWAIVTLFVPAETRINCAV